jgi:hypothetical protein
VIRLLAIIAVALWSLTTGFTAELQADLTKPEAVFAEVFAALPAEVTVAPTEHYHYWRGTSAGREVWGNIRLANGLREKGIVSFGYACGEDSQARYFGAEDGVEVRCEDSFTVCVSLQKKTVVFHLHQLEQTLPQGWELSADEQFVERTCDESGFQFYLMHRKSRNHFLWILDETTAVKFDSLGEGMWLDKRSGFLFWKAGERFVLAAVSQASVKRNDYFDGPFDQLADNYAEKSGRKELMEKAVPECARKIDIFGNYLNSPKPRRVGLAPYFQYESLEAAVSFLEKARAWPDPLEFIAKLGHVK